MCAPLPLALLAVPRATQGLRCGRSFDTPGAQPLGEDFTPAAQVLFARIQACAVVGFGAHAEVHMRTRLVGVQHHHVAMVCQLGLREVAGRLLKASRLGAGRHRQHDVDRFAALADLGDAQAAEVPSIDDRAQRLRAPRTTPWSSSIGSRPALAM